MEVDVAAVGCVQGSDDVVTGDLCKVGLFMAAPQ